jgi:hypothetical protein
MDNRDYIRKRVELEKGSLTDFAKWAAEEAAPWVQDEIKGVLGKGTKPLSPEDAVRSGLATSYKDLLVLPKKDSAILCRSSHHVSV